MIAEKLGISNGNIQTILKEDLNGNCVQNCFESFD